MSPLLSIAIATYRRPGYLGELLEGIRLQVETDSLDVEVVINDNASGDETGDVVRSFESLRPSYEANESNLGAVENVLRAYSRSSGDYVLLMGDDDLLEPGFLGRIIDIVKTDPRPGLITGPVTPITVDGEPTGGAIRFPSAGGKDRDFAAGADATEHTFLRAATLSGLCIRRDVGDPDGVRRHANSQYPQMYLAGTAARDGGAKYLNRPVVQVRDNPIRAWTYSSNFMSSGVFAILEEITRDMAGGSGVRSRVTSRRVRAAYGPLYEARSNSFGSFIRAFRGFASVSQYKKSPAFWGMGLALGLLGIHGIALLRRLIRIKGADRVQ